VVRSRERCNLNNGRRSERKKKEKEKEKIHSSQRAIDAESKSIKSYLLRYAM
jgi:hypothetical protein